MRLRGGHDYLASIAADSSALFGIAADFDLALPVPTCPGWTLHDLVEHVSGANRWVSHCVSSGLTPQERILPSGPSEPELLVGWAWESVDELLDVLVATPTDELVWTPIRGVLGIVGEAIEPPLALDGIDEYAEEFLPLMLLGVGVPPVTAVLLSPNDIDETRTLSLLPAGDDNARCAPTVELKASASDLLLWMWNRAPDGAEGQRRRCRRAVVEGFGDLMRFGTNHAFQLPPDRTSAQVSSKTPTG